MIHTGDCIKIGVIGKTHNLQGAVVVHADADLLERYLHEPVFILLEGAPVPFYIAPGGLTPRNHTSCIVKFDYVDTKARADRLVGRDLLVPRTSLDEDDPADDSPDFIDYTVLDTRTGATGQLLRVDNFSGNIVFTIGLSYPLSRPELKGRNIIDAAVTAAHLRFRPIVMTSLAFILGLLPLVFASGPGSASRQGIGTGVFFGMLVAISVGIVYVPFFFVWIYRIKSKFRKQ